MAIFHKVDSSSGYAFRQPRGYYKHLSQDNLATPLPTEMGSQECDCIETIDVIYSNCPSLRNEPLLNAEEE